MSCQMPIASPPDHDPRGSYRCRCCRRSGRSRRLETSPCSAWCVPTARPVVPAPVSPSGVVVDTGIPNKMKRQYACRYRMTWRCCRKGCNIGLTLSFDRPGPFRSRRVAEYELGIHVCVATSKRHRELSAATGGSRLRVEVVNLCESMADHIDSRLGCFQDHVSDARLVGVVGLRHVDEHDFAQDLGKPGDLDLHRTAKQASQ